MCGTAPGRVRFVPFRLYLLYFIPILLLFSPGQKTERRRRRISSSSTHKKYFYATFL